MRLATNGVPLQCPASLHFSVLNQLRPQSLGNSPVASLTCFTRGSLSAFYPPLPEPKILCLLLIPIAWITLGSHLNLMLPFSHLTSILHPLVIHFLNYTAEMALLKSVFKFIRSFKCLHSVLFLVLTTPLFLLSPTLAKTAFSSWTSSVPRICDGHFVFPHILPDYSPLSFSFTPFAFIIPSNVGVL